jgi:hypothetical protein
MNPPAPPPLPEDGSATPTARVLRWILGLQIAIAVTIMAADLSEQLPELLPASSPATAPGTPVSPGDQTRRYEPSQLMTQTPGSPGFPASGPIPRRLTWNAFEIGDRPALALTGTIAPGDAARFAQYLDERVGPPAVVTLHSPGGSVVDAIAIGRRIRAEEIATRVDSGAACLSACPYVFAAGTERIVGRDAMVGVHQHYFGKNIALPAFLAVADIQRGQAEVLAYLDEMSVDPMLVAKAMQTDPGDIYMLLPDELEAFGLATTVTE